MLMVFSVALVSDYVVSKGLEKTECFSFQWYQEVTSEKLQSEVLIMGNSRAFSHFNPRIIDSICGTDSYNLGIGGYPINIQLAEYHCYKAHNKKPQLIVHQVDISTLKVMYDVRHQHNSERFFPSVYDRTMRRELHHWGYGVLELYCPMYRYIGYREIVKNGFNEFFSISHYVDWPAYKGFGPEEGVWDGTKASKIDSIEGAFDTDAQVQFEDYLKECKKEGIKVLLVNSPFYSETHSKVRNLDELNNYYETIAQKFGFVYLNYTENYAMCNDTSNFSLSMHLTPEAADRFSTDFAHDLDSLGLLQ